MQKRYKKVTQRERSKLLEEMETVTGLHRKSLIRLMNPALSIQRKARQRERKAVYGPEVRYAVALIARALDYPAAERPTPQLVSPANRLTRHGELQVDERLSHLPSGLPPDVLVR